MKLTIKESEILFEMSNMRGKYVKNPHRLKFSFYFSPKDAVESKEIKHGLCVKPIFNPEKMNIADAGVLKLHSDWEYIPGNNDKDVSSSDIRDMKQFFKTYKTMFAAVWEKALPPDSLYDYFRGTITFDELLKEFEFYDDYKEELKEISDLTALTDFIRDHDLFNLWEI